MLITYDVSAGNLGGNVGVGGVERWVARRPLKQASVLQRFSSPAGPINKPRIQRFSYFYYAMDYIYITCSNYVP
jgi:hypothetical protein